MNTHILIAFWMLLATATVAQSRRLFAREVSCWITQKKVPASWEDAERHCESHGRRLDDMPYAVFAAIEQLDIEQGDCLSMDRRGIRAVSCFDHLPYIRYSNETTECGSGTAPTPTPTPTPATSTSAPPPSLTVPPPSSTAPPPSSTAPSGYTHKATTDSWYKYHKTDVSWSAAVSVCASEGGHLVVVNDEVEAENVRDIMRDGGYGSYKYVWIDLRVDEPGGLSYWHTIRGQPIRDVYHGWSGTRAAAEAS